MVMSIRKLVMKKTRTSTQKQLHHNCWYKCHQWRAATGDRPDEKATRTQPRAQTAVVQKSKEVGETGTHKSSARLCKNEKAMCKNLCHVLFVVYYSPSVYRTI